MPKYSALFNVNNNTEFKVIPEYNRTHLVLFQNISLENRMEYCMIPHTYSTFSGQAEKYWSGIFPYIFTLGSLIINGIEYSNGETLTINSLEELQTGVGYCGGLHITNIIDWINTIIPVELEISFNDDMGSVIYPTETTFFIKILSNNNTANIIYDNTGMWVDYNEICVNYLGYSCSNTPFPDVNFIKIRNIIHDHNNNIVDDNGLSRYYMMERGWFNPPYIFILNSLMINNIEYANGETLTINSYLNLQTGIGFDGVTYISNMVDWINSIIPIESGLVFYDDFNVVEFFTGTEFSVEIGPYIYNNTGFQTQYQYQILGTYIPYL